jgi:hypothetical protein
MKKFHFLLCVCGLLSFCKPAIAQSPGFNGHRFALHATGFNGRFGLFNSFGLEYALGRKTSLVLGFDNVSYTSDFAPIRQEYLAYPADPNGYYYANNPFPYEAKEGSYGSVTVKQTGLSLQSRFYLNRITPAPVGRYTRVGLGYHQVQIDGPIPPSFFLSYFPTDNSPIPHTFNCGMATLSTGFGWQWIFYNRLLLNLDLGIAIDYNLGSGADAQALSTVMASGGTAQGISTMRSSEFSPRNKYENQLYTNRLKFDFSGLFGLGILL